MKIGLSMGPPFGALTEECGRFSEDPRGEHMTNAETGDALIGGCLFRNVAVPLATTEGPLLSLTKASSGGLGVDFADVHDAGQLVAEVRASEIELVASEEDYFLRSSGTRRTIVKRKDARVLYDEIQRPTEPTLALSFQTHVGQGCPVFVHPDRIRIGSGRIARPHFSSLRMEAESGGNKVAIRVVDLVSADPPEGMFYDPPTPLVGSVGVVQRMRSESLDEVDPDPQDSCLKFFGDGESAASIKVSKCCYLLDLGFENFGIGIEIQAPTEGADVHGEP